MVGGGGAEGVAEERRNGFALALGKVAAVGEFEGKLEVHDGPGGLAGGGDGRVMAAMIAGVELEGGLDLG